MTDDKKTEVLLMALGERYKSIHIIRDRVQSLGIWALGILLAASAFHIQSGIVFNKIDKVSDYIGSSIVCGCVASIYSGSKQRLQN